LLNKNNYLKSQVRDQARLINDLENQFRGSDSELDDLIVLYNKLVNEFNDLLRDCQNIHFERTVTTIIKIRYEKIKERRRIRF
jgi:hypothetical protein